MLIKTTVIMGIMEEVAIIITIKVTQSIEVKTTLGRTNVEIRERTKKLQQRNNSRTHSYQT
jgi:DNA-directed RNA polymerase subunit L